MPILILAALIAGQNEPGPLDAFLANYASIQAKVTYTFSSGRGSAEAVADGDIWSGDADFVSSPDADIIGMWECDGVAEHYDFSSPERVIEAARGRSLEVTRGRSLEVTPGTSVGGMIAVPGGMPVFHEPMTEALFDGETVAVHRQIVMKQSWELSDVIYIFRNGRPSSASKSGSPFLWDGEYRFPEGLRARYDGVDPERRDAIRGGHPVEVEIYRKDMGPGRWIQYEISYDPSIGYLPRHCRAISHDSAYKTFIGEFYLVEARLCAAGGFVPTEWYVARTGIDGFERRYPDYDAGDDVMPRSGRLGMTHYVATGFEDRSGPVALTRLQGIRAISVDGEELPVSVATRSLTMAAIKARLGSRLTNPATPPAMPSLDLAELQALDASPTARTPDRTSFFFGIAILTASVVVVALRVRRRCRA